jgi:hypothetical protein
MTLKKRGKYQYGDSQADIRDELLRYGKKNEHAAHHFTDAICKCGGKLFELSLALPRLPLSEVRAHGGLRRLEERVQWL